MIYGYCRVSTARQVDHESLGVQQRQIEGYAQMQGFDVARIFVEEGVSGSMHIAERPVGGSLFAALQSGDILIAAKLDRLFRSALDALQCVENLKHRGIRLHLIDLGGDVADNGLSRLFLTIAAAFAEAERDRIRERVVQVKRDQKARGRYLGGGVPFGYRLAKDIKGAHLVPDESAQKAVSVLRALDREGHSKREIIRAARRAGISIQHNALMNVLRG